MAETGISKYIVHENDLDEFRNFVSKNDCSIIRIASSEFTNPDEAINYCKDCLGKTVKFIPWLFATGTPKVAKTWRGKNA